MLIYEYKLDGNKQQYQAIEEAIRVVQFIRNKCVRKWMDGRGVTRNDLQCSCADLAREYPFAARLNSQARQASADRAWAAISRFYENCHNKKRGKKGYPQFVRCSKLHAYRVEGWKCPSQRILSRCPHIKGCLTPITSAVSNEPGGMQIMNVLAPDSLNRERARGSSKGLTQVNCHQRFVRYARV